MNLALNLLGLLLTAALWKILSIPAALWRKRWMPS